MPAALEEVLRHRPPVASMARVDPRETELAGVTVPANVPVMCWLAAGNRDERISRTRTVRPPARPTRT